jgi:acyl phosphate:glycerol-3-phosphate acyltransferase
MINAIPFWLTMALVLFAYLLGSLSSAVIFCKLFSLPDPRTQGSQNPGATNVLRIGNKKVAVLTLGGDFFKGFIPVFIATYYQIPDSIIACVALAAFIGHLYPIFFNFKGGKGVATALGILFALYWPLGLLAGFIWGFTAYKFHYSSLASLITFSLASFLTWALIGSWTLAMAVLIISIMIFHKHKDNLRRLKLGTEAKISWFK